MVREEIGVDCIWVAFAHFALVSLELLCKGRALHRVHVADDLTCVLSEFERKQAVDPGLVQILDIAVLCPVLAHHVDVLLDALAGVVEPLQKFGAVNGFVLEELAGVKAEAVNLSFFQPEFCDLGKFLAGFFGIKIPFGHVLREIRLANIAVRKPYYLSVVAEIVGLVDLKILCRAVKIALAHLGNSLLKQRIVVGNVVQNKVDNNVDAPFVAFLYKLVKILDRSKIRVDVIIVFNVILVIGL